MPSSRPRGWMILAVGLLLVACGPAGGESSTTGAGAANPTAAPSYTYIAAYCPPKVPKTCGTAGPRMITYIAGKIRKTIGKSILIGALWANSSAR